MSLIFRYLFVEVFFLLDLQRAVNTIENCSLGKQGILPQSGWWFDPEGLTASQKSRAVKLVS